MAAHPTRYMPACGHSTAPSFNGNPLNISWFFEDVDILGDDAGIDEAAKIKHALRYASLCDNEIWTWLPSSKGTSWAPFHIEVVALYPGAEDDRRYSNVDLDRLAAKYAAYGIQSQAELGEYFREFVWITEFLKEKGRLSDRERDTAYESRFDQDFKEKIKRRLQYQKPDHFHDELYEFKDFHGCAHFLLAGTAVAADITVTMTI